jgi:hypothetical protein
MSTRDAQMQAGFALAALLCNDRNLTHVRGAVSSELENAARAMLAHDPSEPRAERVRRLLEAVVPRLSNAITPLPPRLLALIASKLPRELARRQRWPLPRSGFTPSPDLIARLLRIARQRQLESTQP